MIKWPKIEAFKDAAHYAKHFIFHPVTYTGTVKLHGSNAGVHCMKDALIPQSRNRILSVKDDNLGFASWVTTDLVIATIRFIEDEIRYLFRLQEDSEIILFGEWCGKGIQKGMALNELPGKQWVLFGAAYLRDGETHFLDFQSFWKSLLESSIQMIHQSNIHFIYEAKSWFITIDFSDPDTVEEAKKQINIWTQEVEAECPWGAMFGIKGMGEGIVWKSADGDSELTFKSKGEQHKIAHTAKTFVGNIPNVTVFVEEYLTEERLNQGVSYLEEMELPTTMQGMSHFLKWVGNDIKMEGNLRLTELNLAWRDVSKLINAEAANWFKRRG